MFLLEMLSSKHIVSNLFVSSSFILFTMKPSLAKNNLPTSVFIPIPPKWWKLTVYFKLWYFHLRKLFLTMISLIFLLIYLLNLFCIEGNLCLKLVSAIFYQIFIFSPNDRESFKNYEKCFLFHLKSSFRSQDIQLFVLFPSFPHFPDSKGQVEVE